MHAIQWTKDKIFYLLAAVAGYLGSFFTMFGSLFLTRVEMGHQYLTLGFQQYCVKNLKRLDIGIKEYSLDAVWSIPKDMQGRVVYELSAIKDHFSIFYSGYRFVIIKRGEYDSDLTVYFSPIGWNVDGVMQKSFEMYYSKESQGHTRYFAKRIHGKLLDLSSKSNPSAKVSSGSPLTYISAGRVIGVDIADLSNGRVQKEPLNNLVFPNEIWSYIFDIERWLKNKPWYKTKSIPWKRGWLLHGRPGTGKTSLARSMAKHFDLPIFSFDLSSFTDQCLSKEWQLMKEHTPCIALIEDIDGVFEGRNNISAGSRMQQSLSFDCLLNTIDGVEDSDGVFTIITTNNIDKVDEALVGINNGGGWTCRPGRIDLAIELKEIDEKCRRELAARIMSDCSDMIESTVLRGKGMTPAQFQYLCESVALRDFWNKHEATKDSIADLINRTNKPQST